MACSNAKAASPSLAFEHAIERSDKGKKEDAVWWEQQGDRATLTREHVEVEV